MEEAVNGNDLAWLFQEAVLNLKRNANEVLARLLLAIHHRHLCAHRYSAALAVFGHIGNCRQGDSGGLVSSSSSRA
ncbi:Os05g0594400 [Oryza sativa Japonica Group]|jgi:hypothetical protein|uniref:Os05g0594400 protein n=1 Tax=Oryza sativa subsp. japonica TaxID=39947 RepID=A0A0P0WRQ1_ORYSJ|nr:Os05g0594400 [Oryza sativa Japonica Group]